MKAGWAANNLKLGNGAVRAAALDFKPHLVQPSHPNYKKTFLGRGAPMPHYGILREQRFEDLEDVRGAEVYGVNDEKLGTIDDVVFNHSTGNIRYIVLKTGGLFTRKRVMVPVNRVQPYGNHTDKFYAELDKERLEMLPEFDDEALKSEKGWDD